jgi:drug/metabolite transporter (DMT)-like permease
MSNFAPGGAQQSAFAAIPDRLKAIMLMCVAVTFFSCLDTSAKYLIAHSKLATAQVVWVRFMGQALLMLLIVGPWNIAGLLRTQKPGMQFARSLLMAATTACNFIAVQYLRLDQTVSIAFLAPLLVALLAGPFLGEWVGWRRMLAILTGFAGILIVVRPGFAEVHWAFAFSFASMLVYSVFMILTRKLAPYDPPLVTLFYSLLAGCVIGAPFAYAHWVWPDPGWLWLQLLSLGALGGTGHYLLILAYRLAPASSVSPFLYFQLLSMVSLGYIVFGDVPDFWTLLGSGVVILSGIYLVHRERIQAREARQAALT